MKKMIYALLLLVVSLMHAPEMRMVARKAVDLGKKAVKGTIIAAKNTPFLTRAVDVAQTPIRAAKTVGGFLVHPDTSLLTLRNTALHPQQTFRTLKNNLSISKGQTSLNNVVDLAVAPVYRAGQSIGNVYQSVRSALSPEYAVKREMAKLTPENLNDKAFQESTFNTMDVAQRQRVAGRTGLQKWGFSNGVKYVTKPVKISDTQIVDGKFPNTLYENQNVPESVNHKSQYTKLNSISQRADSFAGKTISLNEKEALNFAKKTHWLGRLLNRSALKDQIKDALFQDKYNVLH